MIFLYSQYVTLKKIAIARISHKASSAIGQRLTIGDFSLGHAGGIEISDIAIENPIGFEERHLLKVKEVFLLPKYSELVKGRLSFERIEIVAPELTVVKNKSGRLNISDKLREMLSKKGTTKYEIDKLKISSGILGLNLDYPLSYGDISVTLQHLSSDPGTKTLIEASGSSTRNGKISAKGWMFLGDDLQKMDLSAQCSDMQLILPKVLVRKDAANAGEARVDINLRAQGDMKSGIAFRSGIRLKRAPLVFLMKAEDVTLDAEVFLNPRDESLIINNAAVKVGYSSTVTLSGVINNITRSPSYSATARINISDISAFYISEEVKAGGILTSGSIGIRGKLDRALPVVSGSIRWEKGSIDYLDMRGEGKTTVIVFNLTPGLADSLRGTVSLKATALSLQNAKENKKLIEGGTLNFDTVFRGDKFDFKADALAGKLSATLSGTVNDFMKGDRAAKIRAVIPETRIAELRSAFWNIVPDALLYAGLDGSFSAGISAQYEKSGIKAEGELLMKDIVFQGENGEYSIGPVNGAVPIHYNRDDEGAGPLSLSFFERSDFQRLREYYTKLRPEEGSRKITIGSLRYGFKLLDGIELWVNQRGRYLNIPRFDASIFAGKMTGSASIDISDGLNYRAGMIAKEISLTRLCEDIGPIKGYLSGRVDGEALLRGKGAGTTGIIGKADFWAYSAAGEKTKISREFLQKVGGPSVKAYLGERPFDKGIISLYLQSGFLIFKEMEISHKNLLGITDLSVKVAPFNNRIALDHLMATIAEAAERAKEK